MTSSVAVASTATTSTTGSINSSAAQITSGSMASTSIPTPITTSSARVASTSLSATYQVRNYCYSKIQINTFDLSSPFPWFDN